MGQAFSMRTLTVMTCLLSWHIVSSFCLAQQLLIQLVNAIAYSLEGRIHCIRPNPSTQLNITYTFENFDLSL